MGNSEGWRAELHRCTESDPVPCDSSDVMATSYPYGNPEAALGRSESHPIIIDTSMGDSHISLQGDTQEEPVMDYVTDSYYPFSTINLYSTSDPEYVPTGTPYVPTSVRRTPRQHGWTSGLYREEDAE